MPKLPDEVLSRILDEVADLMMKSPDASVADCVQAAMLTEFFLYGDPLSPPVVPVGILNWKSDK